MTVPYGKGSCGNHFFDVVMVAAAFECNSIFWGNIAQVAKAAAARQFVQRYTGGTLLTTGAKDMIVIAGLAGFDAKEVLMNVIFRRRDPYARINAASIENEMGRIARREGSQ